MEKMFQPDYSIEVWKFDGTFIAETVHGEKYMVTGSVDSMEESIELMKERIKQVAPSNCTVYFAGDNSVNLEPFFWTA